MAASLAIDGGESTKVGAAAIPRKGHVKSQMSGLPYFVVGDQTLVIFVVQ